MNDDRVQPRVETKAPGVTYVEMPIDYTDGYRVTVGWSEEDSVWYGRVSGISTGDVLADGQSRDSALLSLCCSLAATIDAVNDS